MSDGNLSIGDLVFSINPLTQERNTNICKILAIDDFIDPDGLTRKNCVARLSDGNWNFIWNLISLEEIKSK